MSKSDFFEKPYDEGTLTKLKIFELYAQAWIPVFLSRPDPPFDEVHIFDFFSGAGADSKKAHGSPLRLLTQVKQYQARNLAGWNKVKFNVNLSDANDANINRLKALIAQPEWRIEGVKINTETISFADALKKYQGVLTNKRSAKLLIIDQFGVDEVSDEVFRKLVSYPTTDFIFFISSQTLHRFRSIMKIKIDEVDSSYNVHRATFNHFKGIAPSDVFLSKFSIRKKRGNIYGLIFGSHHPLGIHKFLQVAWDNDEMRGEANFDIDGENLQAEQGMLGFDNMDLRPQKIAIFERDLKDEFKNKRISSEADIIQFCINAGMTCQHATSVIEKVKSEGLIKCDFRTPNIGNIKTPRKISYCS